MCQLSLDSLLESFRHKIPLNGDTLQLCIKLQKYCTSNNTIATALKKKTIN